MSSAYFVSGHLDLTKEEFEEHYVPRLREALVSGGCFVVGDAPGCDYMAQRWIATATAGSRPSYWVYHMLEHPRHCYGTGYGSHDEATAEKARTRYGKAMPEGLLGLVGGFKGDEERDAAMTAASDYDILWVRPTGSKRHSSGTAKNRARRQQQAQERDRALRTACSKFRITHDYAEFPIIRIEPAEPGDVHAVPLPPELWERWQRAQAACNEAHREWSQAMTDAITFERKQEVDPV